MARVTYSPLIVAASGKVKDTVFSKWKGRNYIRARVTPANPKSAAQTLVRESLARCVSMWQSFNATSKAAWDLYAIPFSLSGYNTFVKANRADEQAGDLLLVSPHHSVLQKVDTFVASTGTGSGEIDIDWTGGTQGAGMYIYAWVREDGTDELPARITSGTLVSALTDTITGVTAATDCQVYIACRNDTTNELSESMADLATSGA